MPAENDLDRIYVYGGEGESLCAVMINNNQLMIAYQNAYDGRIGVQYEYYHNGESLERTANGGGGILTDSERKKCLAGYIEAYQRLGPKLLEKIPLTWKKILGPNWPSSWKNGLSEQTQTEIQKNLSSFQKLDSTFRAMKKIDWTKG